MNGPQHYARAQELVTRAEGYRDLDQWTMLSLQERTDAQAADAAAAQVHATLALVAVTVESWALSAEEMLAWRWAGAVNDADRDRP